MSFIVVVYCLILFICLHPSNSLIFNGIAADKRTVLRGKGTVLRRDEDSFTAQKDSFTEERGHFYGRKRTFLRYFFNFQSILC